MYGLRLFIVVVHYCLHVCMIRVRVCYHFTNPAGFLLKILPEVVLQELHCLLQVITSKKKKGVYRDGQHA